MWMGGWSRENNFIILCLAALPSSAKTPSAKTTQQIIRESVRNMSILPTKRPVPSASMPPTPKSGEGKGTAATKGKRNVQRHSAGTIDYDNVGACGGDGSTADNDSQLVAFRRRSQTIGIIKPQPIN